ncbi:MAG: hypothetical protein HQL16_06660, partial [Candidatus Omnitrophica bacterium]|nr:hypothetical protein [Candidatus Omnitrophota bacterium]
MLQKSYGEKKNSFRKIVSSLLLVCFMLSSVIPPGKVFAQGLTALPAPGLEVKASDVFQPASLKGVKVNIDNPFMFDFIVDKGDSGLAQAEFEAEGKKLIKYFLTALT